jgi:hypothetical protein
MRQRNRASACPFCDKIAINMAGHLFGNHQGKNFGLMYSENDTTKVLIRCWCGIVLPAGGFGNADNALSVHLRESGGLENHLAQVALGIFPKAPSMEND